VKTQLRHYAVVYYPGSFFPEEEIVDLESPDGVALTKKLKKAGKAFGFQMYRQTTAGTGKEMLSGEPKKVGGRVLFGKAYTLKELEAKFPEHTTLISNMKCNKWKSVVKCPTGNWQPVEGDDIVV
jgi:hypothetical protein